MHWAPLMVSSTASECIHREQLVSVWYTGWWYLGSSSRDIYLKQAYKFSCAEMLGYLLKLDTHVIMSLILNKYCRELLCYCQGYWLSCRPLVFFIYFFFGSDIPERFQLKQQSMMKKIYSLLPTGIRYWSVSTHTHTSLVWMFPSGKVRVISLAFV